MTPHLAYRGKNLELEGVPLQCLAEKYGTPLYVYSRPEMIDRYRAFKEADPDGRVDVCYSVKSNANVEILRTFRRLGAGFDVTSSGELFLALKSSEGSSSPPVIVFSGVGKSAGEIEYALRSGSRMINLESSEELRTVSTVARRIGIVAPVSFRVNPNVDPKTHPYIATGLRKHKFGVPWGEAVSLYQTARKQPGVRVVGISCHIGSQIVSLSPVRDAVKRVLALHRELTSLGIKPSILDVGGGLGIRYKDERPASPQDYTRMILRLVEGLDVRLVFEPGRSLVGNAGILLTRVLYRKTNGPQKFVIVDGAMTDLIRPSLYGAYHQIHPVRKRAGTLEKVDVVGPVCESGDFLGKNRLLRRLAQGDLLAVLSVGAYGFAMSSNYNGRLRPAEVMVANGKDQLIRPRQTLDALL